MPRKELADFFLGRWTIKNEERDKNLEDKQKVFPSSLPEGTLCYSEGEIRHYCQVNDEYLISVFNIVFAVASIFILDFI